MMSEPGYTDREIRSAVLKSYDILDTLEEDEFDALTQLASFICGTPVSLISLVDEDRQWFKSHHGIDISETPISLSFCAHAISGNNEIMIIEDPTIDDRFKNNPLVTGDPRIGFYAGVPLVGEDNVALGTLCVIDHYPRTITVDQRNALRTLARQVMDKLELRRKFAGLQRAEQKLQSLYKELAVAERAQHKLVNERTTQLENANAALKRSNEDLLQFAHVSSHDLREPLRKIKYFNSQLKEEELDSLSPGGRDAVQKIEKSVNRILQIVDAVLRYSRDLSTDTDYSTVNLDEIFANVREDLALHLSSQGINIFCHSLGSVAGSSTQLYQLFLNLTSNALKFAHADRPLHFEIKSENFELDGRSFKRIIFSDNGIGFESEFDRTIFSAFTRLHSKDVYEGTGIGLSLCQKIVERHGGTITASGIKGKGASFEVLLPMVQHKMAVDIEYR